MFSLEKRKEIRGGRIEILEKGSLRVSVKLSFEISAQSHLTQVVSLDTLSKGLVFSTHVSWHENKKFLKVEFPLELFCCNAGKKEKI